MKGYRTIAFNGLMLIAGITGVAITPELAEEFAAAVLTVASIVNLILRGITTGPVGTKE